MKKKVNLQKNNLEKSQLYNFLSQLKLDKSVVYGNKDKGNYCIDLNKKIDGFHKDIQQRIETIKPDAVYFFNSQPLILFFDLTEQNRDLDELYKQVWSFDSTSIIFIIKKSEIQVFNALNYVKNNKQNSLEEITLSQQEIKRLFNLWELKSGKTWEWIYNRQNEMYIKK